jgi:hypothetical protein
MAWSDYQIAVGNNNAAGLALVESLVPSGNIAVAGPAANGYRNPGVTRIRANGLSTQSGYLSQLWRMVFLTYEQYNYLKTTYCGGGYSGLVTVRTHFTNQAYANYNAVLIMPYESDLAQSNVGWGYQGVELLLSRMVALA